MILSRVNPETLSVFSTFDQIKAPAQLSVQSKDGDYSMLEELPSLGLAIVGTRYPQKRSLELLEETIYGIRNTKLIIVSGFARGIDARAHELALQYGLRTVALFGSGISLTYPVENRQLRQAIIDGGGLVISQFPDEEKPYASHFFRRNLLIAGFSKATWVVEAAAVSGTLNTANAAAKLNRDLYATSCFPKDHYYQGNVKLLHHRNPDRYPFAYPFFNVESLSNTWPGIGLEAETQTELAIHQKPMTEIQKWVMELQTSAGECRVQTLMNHASQSGYTLGKFYHLFEAEVRNGLLKQDATGRVEVIF